MMEETFVKVEEITDSLKEYVEVRVEEIRLKVAEKSSGLIANLMARIMVFIGLCLAVLFASVALAISLGNWWGSLGLGFLAVGGLYLVLAWVIWSLRESLIRIPMMNSILSHLTKKSEDDTE
jgi:fatty acid desaturase